MKDYLKVFLILFVLSLAILALYRWTGIKDLIVKLRRPSEEVPSMIRALPFDTLQERRRGRLDILRDKLTPTQILVEDVVGLPRGAPLGKYLRVSIVVEASDRKRAREIRKMEGYLATLVLETIQDFPYEKLKSGFGIVEFKKALTRRISMVYGDWIREVSIVEFRTRRHFPQNRP